MGDNEEATVRVLINEVIKQYHGRVIDSSGDNILTEFASMVGAVNGAIKIQDEIKKGNSGIHEDRGMEFRVGINLGDVVEEEDRIYGDGVNIAVRVEGLTEAGGIAISGTVYEHIRQSHYNVAVFSMCRTCACLGRDCRKTPKECFWGV